jgi:hypothetical protein
MSPNYRFEKRLVIQSCLQPGLPRPYSDQIGQPASPPCQNVSFRALILAVTRLIVWREPASRHLTATAFQQAGGSKNVWPHP